MIVADVVRLHREDEERRYYYCCFCGIVRFIIRILEWLLFRWYQPDLASYMSQTVGSLEKLRLLIERGEGGAYASNDLEGGDLDGENGDMISAPLLG